MKPSFRMLAAFAVVCALVAFSRTPSAHASTPVPTAATTDRDVLVALYHATDGDNWRDSDSWLSDAPIGTWYGVTTDNSGRVIELVLWFNNLSGTIPPELGDLTALTALRLNGNNLSGSIPPELGNLTALTALNLSDNQLSGTIPPELGHLGNLDALYLAGNRLTGCQLAVWKYADYNDLDQLGLPYCAAPTSARSTGGDRDGLVALYLATDGDNWANNDNWLSDAPISTWYGVTADVSGRVIELVLWFNNLSGTIPPELSDLTALTKLDFSGNQLSGTIPAELSNLTALTYLSLGGNQLSGTIPSELSNLTALTNLYLGNNQLRGIIPSELGNLTALTHLDLGNNQLNGPIPPELGNLVNLETLYLAGNRLTGCQLAVWKYVKDNDLDQLGLPYCAAATDRDVLVALYWAADGDKWINNDNWLSDAPLGTWFGVTTDGIGRVIELDLWYNNLHGTLPPKLGDLTALTSLSLSLSGNNLSGTIPPELGNLTALTSLSLSGNDLSGTIPPELGNLTALTSLRLSSNDLSGTVPPELGNLTALTSLRLNGNNLSGSIPPELGNLTALTSLNLSDNQLSDDSTRTGQPYRTDGPQPQRQPAEWHDSTGTGQPHRTDEPQTQ